MSIATGDEVIELTDLTVVAAATVPATAPITARVIATGRWPARGVPLSAALSIRIGEAITVPHALVVLGDALVVADDVHLEPLAGRVLIAAPARTIAALVPGVALPGDVVVTIVATPAPDATRVALDGALGTTRLQGAVLADLVGRTARGVIGGVATELGPLTGDVVRGHGTAVVAFTGDALRSRATATVIARGAIEGAPAVHAILGVEAELGGDVERAVVVAVAAGDGELRVGALGTIRRLEGALHVEPAHVGASVRDPRAASGGLVPVTGAIDAAVTVTGPLAALVATGAVNATRLAYDDLRVGGARGRFVVRLGPAPGGTAHVDLVRVARAGVPLGAASVDATTRADGRIAIRARARPAAAPIVVEASALVTLGDVIDVALGRHRVQTSAGVWAGTGGRVRIDDRRIAVRGFRSASGEARVGAEVTITTASGAVAAELALEHLPAAMLDPAYGGTLDGALSIARRGTRWAGSARVTATQLALGPEAPTIDGEARLTVEGRRVTVTGTARNAAFGGARVVVEVDGPQDLTDPDAWMRVPRGDLQAVIVGLERVDLAALTDGRTAGTIDGTVELRDGIPSGTITLAGMPTPAGLAGGELTLALTEIGFVDLDATASIDIFGRIDAAARLKIPDRPFDPRAWQRLGPNVVDRVTATARDLAIDARVLALLGLSSPLRGRASVEVAIEAGGSAAALRLDVKEVRGPPLVRPIDLQITARADATGTAGAVRISTGATTLVELADARSPATIGQWTAAPARALAAALAGTLVIPRAQARDLLALVGRTEVLRGSLEGRIELGGTLGRPQATATLDLRDIQVRPRLAMSPPPTLTALHVEAGWDGTRARLALTGAESNRGTLAIELAARPDRLETLTGTVAIKRFDLAPIVVFLPGALVGTSGRLDAELAITGVDLLAGSVTGRLALTDGRMPLAPTIGTLRRANAVVEIDRRGVTATLDGRIGAGTVKLAAATGLDGATTTIRGSVSRVSPITASQPVLDGEVRGTLRRDGRIIRGTLTIANAAVLVPERSGNELLDAALPEDVIFVDGAFPVPRVVSWDRAPRRPWLIVDVELQPTRIVVPEFAVLASAVGKVTVSVGDTVGLDGEISVERGNADVLGHRYRVELARVTFDGTIDPRFEVQLAHDFPDVTTFVRLSGRLSALDEVERELTSDPAIYSENQLLGFLLGGEPGGDPTKQTTEAAAGFGAAIASS